MRKFKTFEELYGYVFDNNFKYKLAAPIIDAWFYLRSDKTDFLDPMYPELSSTFLDFYPDGMTEQEAIDFFTEFIKRKGKYVQIN